MTVLEMVFLVGIVCSILAAILQKMGKTKIAEILKIVAAGVDKSKEVLGSKSAVTQFIEETAQDKGLLGDLNAFLKDNKLNKKTN